MKVLMKSIQVYALWRENGKICPMAFCLEQEGKKYKFAVTAVNSCREERLAGRKVIYFDCLVSDSFREKTVCLRYDVADHCWYLYKA